VLEQEKRIQKAACQRKTKWFEIDLKTVGKLSQNVQIILKVEKVC